MGVRIGFMAVGAALIIFSFWTHCAKKLTVDYAVAWTLLGACLVLMGAVPALSEWTNDLEPAAKWTDSCIGALFLFTGLHESLVNSQMVMKSKELAMQVALLNQENEAMKAELAKLAEAWGEADAEKDFICH